MPRNLSKQQVEIFKSIYHVCFCCFNQTVEDRTCFCTIGRKNFVMIESSNSAKASAILYRLVETTKANMANTFEYFNLLLTEIPQHIDDKDLIFVENFLPWSPSVHKECPADTKSLDLSMYISIL